MESLLWTIPSHFVESFNQVVAEEIGNLRNSNMLRLTVPIWVFCLTLVFFVLARAEGWTLPAKRKGRLLKSSRNSLKGADASPGKEEEAGNRTYAERTFLPQLPWWEDSWAEAFLSNFRMSGFTGDVGTENVTDELAHYSKYNRLENARVLHFCFLLHGHRGLSTDLSYLQTVMQHYSEEEKTKRYGNISNEDKLKHDLIVHCATSNELKTMDGVANGGERLVKEILQVIRTELEKRGLDSPGTNGVQDITISIVGNSLGGIYGRYAIAKLADEAAINDTETLKDDTICGDQCVLLDNKYRLHFNIFCTTATPHLGISKHTYVPLPRSVEIGVAHALGDTGRDLFRLNNLLKTMATCPTFLKPLSNFRKRIAYANAYGTDFPVPATTAAFLSDESTYPHEFAEEEPRADLDSSRKHVVATLQTPQTWEPSGDVIDTVDKSEEGAIADDLFHMSQSLDSLGWKKVFVDIRKEIPIRVSLPRTTKIREKLSNSSLVSSAKMRLRMSSNRTPSSEDESDTSSSSDDSINISPGQVQTPADEGEIVDITGRESAESSIEELQQRGTVGSRDIAYAVSNPTDSGRSFPIGHNLLVAMSRDGQLTKSINKGGRPVMDALAKELVGSIFDWSFDKENDEALKAADPERSTAQREAAAAAETT